MPTVTIGGSGNGNSGGSGSGNSGRGLGVGQNSRNWGNDVWSTNDYPSGRSHGGGHSNGSSSESKSNGSYIESERVSMNHFLQKQQVTNVASSLIKLHGSKPGLILGYNPEIPYTIKDDCGFSLQIKGLINDLNYQLKVSGFKDAKGIVLPHSDLRDVDMAILVPHLQPFQWNLTVIDFSNNAGLGDKAIENLFYTMGTHQVPDKFVQSFNLSNCNIGDYGANYIAESLKSGRYPATKSIDLSGNNITATGDTKLVQALKEVGQDIVVFTHTLDEINNLSGAEGKETQITALKNIVERGKAVGTYNEALVVDKSLWGNIKNTYKGFKFGSDWLVGFGKCHLLPEPEQVIESYAQDKIIATLPTKTANGLSFTKKYVGKLLSFHDIVTCFVISREDALMSEYGQDITKHELCVVGVDEFCGE